jgi:hypothetical protein
MTEDFISELQYSSIPRHRMEPRTMTKSKFRVSCQTPYGCFVPIPRLRYMRFIAIQSYRFFVGSVMRVNKCIEEIPIAERCTLAEDLLALLMRAI